MGGRHRTARQRRRIAQAPMVVALLTVAITGVVLVARAIGGPDGCDRDQPVALTVAADPAIAPALREAADVWSTAGTPAVDGRCVTVRVTGAATAEVAEAYARHAGTAIDAAATPITGAPEPGDLPAVWVPDSSYWITRIQTISRGLLAPDARSLAASPVVIATTADAADALDLALADSTGQNLADGPVPAGALGLLVRQGLPVTVAEPRRDTAGLVGTAWLQAALAPDEADLPAAVGLFRGLGEVPPDTGVLLTGFGEGLAAAPASEQAVIAHNAAAPAVPLTPVAVDGAPMLDFPYTVAAGAPSHVQAAAGQFRDALADQLDVFARHGFRVADGSPGPGFPAGEAATAEPVPAIPVGPTEQISAVLRIWTSSRRDARVLSVVNVNASMQDPIAGEGSPTRIEVFQATAAQGIELFTPDSQLGVWQNAEDWTEVVPTATLTTQQKEAVLTTTAALQTGPDNTSAMFETLLAAYQQMKESHDPGRSNTLLLWTDGGSNLPDGLSLEQTQRELERLVDLTRPIRVILLGLGPDADMAQLDAIAQATGGGAYQLRDPDQISLIFLQALLT